MINEYSLEYKMPDYPGKSYVILGYGKLSTVLDSASQKDVEISKHYIEKAMTDRSFSFISLKKHRILPSLIEDPHKGKIQYKIYGIFIDPKSVAAIMDLLASKSFTTESLANFTLYINDKNQIFQIELEKE